MSKDIYKENMKKLKSLADKLPDSFDFPRVKQVIKSSLDGIEDLPPAVVGNSEIEEVDFEPVLDKKKMIDTILSLSLPSVEELKLEYETSEVLWNFIKLNFIAYKQSLMSEIDQL